MSKLTHLNEAGEASMVDVSGKSETRRRAVAREGSHQVDAILVPAATRAGREDEKLATVAVNEVAVGIPFLAILGRSVVNVFGTNDFLLRCAVTHLRQQRVEEILVRRKALLGGDLETP